MVKTDLTHELALITGATGGIGNATARCLAIHGCAIAIHYKSSAAEAADLAKTLHESYGVRAKGFQADLSDYEEVSLSRFTCPQSYGEPCFRWLQHDPIRLETSF